MLKASPAAALQDADASRPAHVAIIMDGNGRWATARGRPRLAGHKRGVEVVRRIVESCPDLGVRNLTLYAFSTENWKRSLAEVRGLMSLFRIYIRKEARALHREGVRVRFLGDREMLAPDLVELMIELENLTQANTRLGLNIALNYGGRAEILAAARRIACDAAAGRIDPAALDDAAFGNLFCGALCTAGLPDPDLVIRTSGEMRVSNFLTWQSAYSEFAFVEECWPDFTVERFAGLLEDFGCRERRFGAVGA